jgi:hypothetical protein
MVDKCIVIESRPDLVCASIIVGWQSARFAFFRIKRPNSPSHHFDLLALKYDRAQLHAG